MVTVREPSRLKELALEKKLRKKRFGTSEVSNSSCVDRQIPPIEDTESDSDKFWISSSVGDLKERCSCVEVSKSLLEDVHSRKLLDDSKGLFSSE